MTADEASATFSPDAATTAAAQAEVGVVWRAPDSMGAKSGLREYQRQLAGSGHSAMTARLSAGDVVTTAAGMTFRGFFRKFRFKRAAGTPLIGRHVRLRGARYITVGKRLRIDDYVEIQGTSTGGITLGDRVTLGKFVTIRPSGLYGRFLGVGLTVGDGTSIGPMCYLGCFGGITIGSDVMLAPDVRIFAESHNFESTGQTIKSQGLEVRPVVIEDDCWIASGVIVTGGVRIGKGSIVGAGSVVTKDVPAGSIVAGNPARVIRSRTADDAPGLDG